MEGVYVGVAIYYIFVDLVVSIGISMRCIFLQFYLYQRICGFCGQEWLELEIVLSYLVEI